MLIDTHAHLDLPEFASDLPAVLERARTAGLVHVVSVSVGLASLKRNLEIAAGHPGNVPPRSARVHPPCSPRGRLSPLQCSLHP